MLATINTRSLAHWTQTVAAQVANGTWFFAVTLLALFLILYDGERLAANVFGIARRFYGEFGERFVDQMGAAVRAAVNGTVLVAIGEGTLIGVGYAVAGVPRPLLFTIATIAFATARNLRIAPAGGPGASPLLARGLRRARPFPG